MFVPSGHILKQRTPTQAAARFRQIIEEDHEV